MKVIFVRHGEPDYSEVTDRSFKGHGRDLAKLSLEGIEQVKETAKDPRLNKAQIIISSPYTRALQTAAIISKTTRHDIEIATYLHEWLPDLTFNYGSDELVKYASRSITQNKGECPEGHVPPYETLQMVFDRVKKALLLYKQYDTVIAVCHGVVIRQFKFSETIPYAEIVEVEIDTDTQWVGFVN